MARYTYKCPDGHETDVSHAMGQVIVVSCPECGKNMRRIFSVPNVLWSRFIELSPAVKKHLDHLDEYKDRNAQKYGR